MAAATPTTLNAPRALTVAHLAQEHIEATDGTTTSSAGGVTP